MCTNTKVHNEVRNECRLVVDNFKIQNCLVIMTHQSSLSEFYILIHNTINCTVVLIGTSRKKSTLATIYRRGLTYNMLAIIQCAQYTKHIHVLLTIMYAYTVFLHFYKKENVHSDIKYSANTYKSYIQSLRHIAVSADKKKKLKDTHDGP